ncbi:MbcA/ParS/Xre antitoxin family protein [Rhizobium oryzicola]|uniref:MbcA/ParS/Xre antitoxin family protein n=1 Tax=Rhizobium oryzicola TaxID=1232668 RepID=A0ABT8SSP1_9HYPH|nr:MbcA/ParS/Xre antitoxin family protein [Rhizobium oryzicola]MDO1581439.1 MbcA/ParS/Xre antitoxin family protein [Rhizobium oryzicola]
MSSLALSSPRSVSEGAVVAKAVVNAAEQLGLNGRRLGDVLGLSEASVSRLKKAELVLQPGDKAFELALLLIRLFRSLDAITGGDSHVARLWMQNDNTALGARPLDKISTITGLIDVLSYLDARRALV